MSEARDRANEFVGRLAGVYGDGLVAAALYGSAARGEYRQGVSDLNLLVLLREVDAAALSRGSELAREWVRAGNPPPLMMSEAEWAGSADVFPIEYADIRDAHVLLHGPELFADLEIDWNDLRLQVERELKEKKIQLRERYMLSAGEPDAVGALLRQSFPTFLALFRAALRLMGRPVPGDAESVLREVATEMGFAADPWLRVARARAAGEALAPAAGDPLVAGYLDGVTRASDWIDGVQESDDHPGV